MSAPRCTRLSEVEAARDGRLGAAERASFERHLPTCADCREESRVLSELGGLLKGTSAPEADQVAVRRRRQRLLLEADEQSVSGGTREKRARGWGVLAIAALVLLGLVAVRARRPSPVATTPAAASTSAAAPITEIATIRAREGAKFTRVRDGLVERVDLREGELAIAVLRSDIGEHVLVTLPDGELEDLGTRFIVIVEGGLTRAVSVQEGLVVLRLKGREPIHIAAGASWTREVTPVPTAPVCAPSVFAPSGSASPATAKIAPSGTPSLPTSAAASADTDGPAVVDPAAVELKAAMTSFRSGEHRMAAAKLAAFISAHPNDPRSEDAAYVRIIALQRAGDHAAARVAALDYLARYPKGFRRPEVEAMTH